MKIWVSVFIFCFYGWYLSAQNPQQQQPPASPTTTPTTDFILLEEQPDTTPIRLYNFATPFRLSHFGDTLLGPEFYQYDKTRRQGFWGNLGNIGTAARNLAFEAPFRQGLDIGLHAYDFYFRKAETARFYSMQKPYSQAAHTGVFSKFNTTFDAFIGRNFDSGFSFSAEYQRINNRGLYQRQTSFHTIFNIGLRWVKNKRYDATLVFASNVASNLESGGIRSDSLFNDNSTFFSTLSLDVKLKAATTRHDHKELLFRHHYLIFPSDTLRQRKLKAFHQARYEHVKYKFYDTDPDTSQSNNFYQDFLVNIRGLRHFILHDNIENEAGLELFVQNEDSTAIIRNGFSASLKHNYHILDREIKDSTLQTLFAKGTWYFSPIKNILLKTEGHFGVSGDYFGDYRIHSQLFTTFGKWMGFRGEFLHQRYSPSLIHGQFFVSGQEIWYNDFLKPLTTSLGGYLDLPFIGVQVGLNYHLVNNWIYFDANAKAKQEATAINILQWSAKAHLHWKWLHWMGEGVLQLTNNEAIMRMPKVLCNTSLYSEFSLFKKVLRIRVGTEARIQSAWNAEGYHPIIGQFYNQNQGSVNAIPSIDGYLAAKVKTFRIFFKYEGIQTYWQNQRFYYTWLNPYPDKYFRMGVDWKFSD